MRDYKSLTHTRWDCKHHIVFIPKCRQKVIYGQLRRELGDVFHELARRRKIEIVEGHLIINNVIGFILQLYGYLTSRND